MSSHLICNALCDLVPFVQFKKRKNTHRGVLLHPATLLKVSLLHGCFSRFLNCTNGTKSSKLSNRYVVHENDQVKLSEYCFGF